MRELLHHSTEWRSNADSVRIVDEEKERERRRSMFPENDLRRKSIISVDNLAIIERD